VIMHTSIVLSRSSGYKIAVNESADVPPRRSHSYYYAEYVLHAVNAAEPSSVIFEILFYEMEIVQCSFHCGPFLIRMAYIRDTL